MKADPTAMADLLGSSSGLALGVMGLGNDMVPNFAAALTAAEKTGQAQVLSEPLIICQNNKLGKIEINRDVNYTSDWQWTGGTSPVYYGGTINDPNNNNSSSTDGRWKPTIKKDKTTISLQVTPSVPRNSTRIELYIQPYVKELLGFTSSLAGNPNDTRLLSTNEPEFSEKKIATSVAVENNQTIVLGGIISERDVKAREGVPVLSRIPLFGALFRSDKKQTERRKLLIFVTASLVDPTGARYSDEIRHLRDTAVISLPALNLDEIGNRRNDEDAAAKAEGEREAQEREKVFKRPSSSGKDMNRKGSDPETPRKKEP